MVKSLHISKWLLYLALSFAPFGGLCGHVNATLSRRTPCLALLVTSPLLRSTGKPSKATSKNMCSTAGTKRGLSTWNATPVALPFCGVGSWPKITTFTFEVQWRFLPLFLRLSAKCPNKDVFFSLSKRSFHGFGIQLFIYLLLSILFLVYLTLLHQADLTKQSGKKKGIKMNKWMNKKINFSLSRATYIYEPSETESQGNGTSLFFSRDDVFSEDVIPHQFII